MFYSHQLLARKAPLGQIWMAATMHAKINRRKLDKLNIISICEEILNPYVPMALRLSGILMGGVVIVYKRKVKVLYEDVTRLLVEINDAWKVKSVADPTVLPKGKSQAKYHAVTLPENQEAELGEIEQSLHYSNLNTIMGFQKTANVAMRLDNVDEPFISHNPKEQELPQNYHQDAIEVLDYATTADPANITLFEHFDSYQADTSTFNRFERFDIEGDEDEAQGNFAPQEHTEIQNTLIPSPPFPKPPEDHANQQSDEGRENLRVQQGQARQRPSRRRVKKFAAPLMDYEQTIIPGRIYQSWLQNTSDIVSRRGIKRKHWSTMPSMKIAKLMELPPVGLLCGLFTNQESYYPAPLLKQWMRSTQPPQDCPSGRTSPVQPPEPSSSSPPERPYPQDDFRSGVGSQSQGLSIEKQMPNVNKYDMPSDILTGGIRTSLVNHPIFSRASEKDRMPVTEANLVTPGNSDEVISIHSSGSGHGSVNSDVKPIRKNMKRTLSASRHNGSGLEPVAAEHSWHQPDSAFKLARLYETGAENDLLVETGPTQTQHNPIIDQPTDQITDSICMHLKMHFDTPGSAQTESLIQLALGMNMKRAASLFYQTCVIAMREYIRVVQRVPYGDILISRGIKM